MPKDCASSRISRPRASTYLVIAIAFCTCLPSRATRRSYRHGVLQLADWAAGRSASPSSYAARLSPGEALWWSVGEPLTGWLAGTGPDCNGRMTGITPVLSLSLERHDEQIPKVVVGRL
jgi:hypothetical protein